MVFFCSLGCVLLLESIKALPQQHRPHEVHLLAPALTEEHLAHNIAQVSTRWFCTWSGAVLPGAAPGAGAGGVGVGSWPWRWSALWCSGC